MQQRTFGSDLSVSAIGLGCMGMREFYGSRDDEEPLTVLQRAVDLGIDFLDNADIYELRHTDELIGRSIDNSAHYMCHACEGSLKRLGTNAALVEVVRGIAAQKGCTPAQVALAWSLGKGDDIAPIPGTKRIKYLEESTVAASTMLSANESAVLEKALSNLPVLGERYTAEAMKGLNACL